MGLFDRPTSIRNIETARLPKIPLRLAAWACKRLISKIHNFTSHNIFENGHFLNCHFIVTSPLRRYATPLPPPSPDLNPRTLSPPRTLAGLSAGVIGCPGAKVASWGILCDCGARLIPGPVCLICAFKRSVFRLGIQPSGRFFRKPP